MKKLVMVLVAAMVMMFSANFVFADDVNVGVENNNLAIGTGGNAWQQEQQKQKQQQGQNQQNNVNISTPGSLPVAGTHGAGMPIFPMSNYGHLVTQASVDAMMSPCEVFTWAQFETLSQAMTESGEESWEEMNGRIIPYPFIKNTFGALGKSEHVHFADARILARINPRDVKVVGGFVYNSKFKKEKPVIPMYYNPRAYLDASRYGANVILFSDQFFQGYFVPEGFEFSLGGVLSWITKCFTYGAGVAGNVGYANGQNTEFGRTGAAFIFLRIEGFVPEMCYEPAPPPTPVICPPSTPQPVCDSNKIGKEIEREEGIYCPNLNRENMERNLRIANLDIEMYVCTGDKTFLGQSYEVEASGKKFDGAIGHFKRAEKSFLNLKSEERASVQSKIDKAYFNWSGCKFVLEGRESALKFADEKSLEKICTGFQK